MNFALQRKNMVETQVRPSDITDRRIIRAMLNVPREVFCPHQVRATAYCDEPVRVSGSAAATPRHMAAPRVLAKMLQALELGDNDSVLEVGTATGYGAAILSRIAHRVTAIEVDQPLIDAARSALEATGAVDVVIVQGELAAGHAPAAPYDAILVAGAVPEVPRSLLDQLKDGGRLAAVISGPGIGHLTQWRRLGGAFDSRVMADATTPLLPGFDRPHAFVF